MSQIHTDGDVRFVQFPHPGREHAMPATGRREWTRGNQAHARTFLESTGNYRPAPDEPELTGPVAFWGEWEGAVELVRPLDPIAHGPRALCKPDPAGQPPAVEGGVPPQNTDPFVWGDAFRYTYCRQRENQKLRRLGRGSLILFGASPKRGFELDTVLVVAGWTEHRREEDLAEMVDDEYRRRTIGPMYGWNEDPLTYRLYYGATPEAPVNGMFSFVPCEPADSTIGFARPILDLGTLLNPNLRMAARVQDVDADRISNIWRDVVRQVTEQDLALATRLALPT